MARKQTLMVSDFVRTRGGWKMTLQSKSTAALNNIIGAVREAAEDNNLVVINATAQSPFPLATRTGGNSFVTTTASANAQSFTASALGLTGPRDPRGGSYP
jgi:hypothetical protein